MEEIEVLDISAVEDVIKTAIVGVVADVAWDEGKADALAATTIDATLKGLQAHARPFKYAGWYIFSLSVL